MSDELTSEQIDRIIANHETGVHLTGNNLYRQLRSLMEENAALKAREDRRKHLRRLVCGKARTAQ